MRKADPSTQSKRKIANRPIRELRKILEKKQADFARMLGVSRDLIASIEAGRCGVSQKVLDRILVATGATCIIPRRGERFKFNVFLSPVQFLEWDEDKQGKPIPKTFRNYRRNDFDKWQKRWNGSEESVRKACASVTGWIELLFLAAAKGGRQAQLWHALCGWMDEAKSQFRLDAHIDGVLRENREAGEPIRKWNPRSGVPPW